jgi:hypothetical protein
LKLFLKPPPQQHQPPPPPPKPVEVATTLKRGRRRRTSDVDSEPEVLEKRSRGRKRSEKSENIETVERKSVRTLKQANDSDTDTYSDRRSRKVFNHSDNDYFSDKRTRKFSDKSDTEVAVESKVRTRRHSNTEKDRNSNYDESEFSVRDVKIDRASESDGDDDLLTSRHPSRTRNFGSRNSRTSPDELPGAVPTRSTRSKVLNKIEEEPEEKFTATNYSSEVVADGDVVVRPTTAEAESEVADRATSSSPEPTEVLKPIFKVDPLPESRPAEPVRRTYGGSRNSRAKPPVPPAAPEAAKPEVESPSADLKFVPETELSSLTRARTVASDTNVAAEFKSEFRNRLKTEETSQPVLSTTKPPPSSSSSAM